MTDPMTPKERALDVIQRMEDDSSYEEILYEMEFLRRVERGIKEAAEGKVASHAEVVESVRKWLTSSEREWS